MGYLGCVVDSCREQFDRPVTLAVHILSHELHDCEFCKQRYTEIQHHLSTHTAEIKVEPVYSQLKSTLAGIKTEQVSQNTVKIKAEPFVSTGVKRSSNSQDEGVRKTRRSQRIMNNKIKFNPATVSFKSIQDDFVYDNVTDSDCNNDDNEPDNASSSSPAVDSDSEQRITRALNQSERPFSCDICGASRAKKDRIQTHIINKHLSPARVKVRRKMSKAHGCVFCAKAYSSRRYLRRHIVHSHEREAFADCSLCGFNSSIKGLECHMATVHGQGDSVDLLNNSVCYSFGKDLSVDALSSNNSISNSSDKAIRIDVACSGSTASHSPAVKTDNFSFENDGTDNKGLLLGKDTSGDLFNNPVCYSISKDITLGIPNSSNTVSQIKAVKTDNFPLESDVSIDSAVKTEPAVNLTADANPSLTCAFCQKTFASLRLVRLHLLAHEQPPQRRRRANVFLCDICGFIANVKHKLHYHMFRMHVPRRVKCDVCSKLFAFAKDLETHKFMHTEVPQFMCEMCGAAYQTRSRLYTHIKNVHLPQGRPLPKIHICQTCGRAYNRKSHLMRHQDIHGLRRQVFACQLCERKYINERSLKSHVQIHHEGKRFACKFCQRLFQDKGVLTIHMRLHTGERPFKCACCDSSFMSSLQLKRHRQFHHEGGKSLKALGKINWQVQ